MAGLRKTRKATSFVGLGALSLLTALALAACSSDEATPAIEEPSGEQTGGSDGEGNTGGAGAEEASCADAADGESCGDASICLDGECAPSRCGDGFVDEASGEDCEDGNAETGDGCSLCRFDCTDDASCDDGAECNGEESCNTRTHRCEAGTEADDQTECELDSDAGLCRSGACVPAGCGNAEEDEGEDCDDGNEDDADGCTKSCTFTCVADADCDNGNACDGAETCDLDSNTCVAGEAMSCEAKGCSGECSPELGECVFPDGDADGVSCDADCNDEDEERYPGAFECEDTKDNDCNPDTADKGAPSCECYVDGDGDGYAASTTGSIEASGACPAKYTRTRPTDEATTDCGVKVAAANPAQKEFFPTAYCPGPLLCLVGSGSFDYNCDGEETSSLSDNKIAAASCAGANGIVFCSTRSGWVTKVPACGAEGVYRACSWVDDACVGTDISDRVRPCR